MVTGNLSNRVTGRFLYIHMLVCVCRHDTDARNSIRKIIGYLGYGVRKSAVNTVNTRFEW